MIRTIRLKNNKVVNIVTPESINSVLTEEDIEMDYRANEAVKAAINKAKVCKKPIARYDMTAKKAYIQMPDGEKVYV